MSVRLHKRARPKGSTEPPQEVTAALSAIPSAFGQLGMAAGAANLDIKALAGQPGLYRVRVGSWRAVFYRAGEDFIVGALGLRKDIYERVDRMRLARKGEGVRLIELPAPEPDPAPECTQAGSRVTRRRPKPVESNPLTPFSDAELRRISGVDTALVEWLRSLPPSVDVGEALGERVVDPDLALLLTDLWERPANHVAAFAAGGAPTVADVVIDDAELAQRVASPDSETEIVEVTSANQIRRLLDATIEEWMVYLHPSQRSIVRAEFTGPARVRGGPGTGKTVVALHRARRLARQAPGEQRVLLTTFLRTLPKVWQGLMATMDARALEQLDVINIDSLAMRIVGSRDGRVQIIEESARRSLAGALMRRHNLAAVFAGNETLLLEEFDAFISGRGMTELDEYVGLRRRGGGIPLVRSQRERVWAAYEDYRRQLTRGDRLDYALLRVRALEAASHGAGERYAGVIVDEAQDITQVGLELLQTLDVSTGHQGLMVIGDGQQSIYPGGFSLGSVGIDVRGRSRVLTANWRNTWNVWTAARALIEGEEFDDLDDDVGLRPTGDEPEPLTMGEPTELHILRTPEEELELLVALVQERLAAGVSPGDIAILVDVKRKGEDVVRALREASVDTHNLERYAGEHADGVLVGTLKRAKGLEFKEVFIVGLAASEWPSRWFVPPDLPEDLRGERIALQRRTLFVGMTRARDRLVLLSGGPPADPVIAAGWTMDVREY